MKAGSGIIRLSASDLTIIWRAIISRHWILLCRSGRDLRRRGVAAMPASSRSAAQRTEMPISFIWRPRVWLFFTRERSMMRWQNALAGEARRDGERR